MGGFAVCELTVIPEGTAPKKALYPQLLTLLGCCCVALAGIIISFKVGWRTVLDALHALLAVEPSFALLHASHIFPSRALACCLHCRCIGQAAQMDSVGLRNHTLSLRLVRPAVLLGVQALPCGCLPALAALLPFVPWRGNQQA